MENNRLPVVQPLEGFAGIRGNDGEGVRGLTFTCEL
jgi:hypothetical protein